MSSTEELDINFDEHLKSLSATKKKSYVRANHGNVVFSD